MNWPFKELRKQMFTDLSGHHSNQNLLTEVYLLQEARENGRWKKLEVQLTENSAWSVVNACFIAMLTEGELRVQHHLMFIPAAYQGEPILLTLH